MICPAIANSKCCNTEMRVAYQNKTRTEYMCPRVKCQAHISRSNVLEEEEIKTREWNMMHQYNARGIYI